MIEKRDKIEESDLDNNGYGTLTQLSRLSLQILNSRINIGFS